MTATDKRRAEARKILIPLAKDLSTAGNTLANWRADAGPKSKWSNHVRMHEMSLFTDFQTKAKALGDALVPLIPAHWEMSDWGFKPHRMGGKLSWGNKGGQGRSGFEVATQNHHFSSNLGNFTVEIGAMLALATHDFAPTEDEAARMRELRLSGKERIRFSLYYHPGGWKEEDGISPTEARARQMLRGDAPIALYLGDQSRDPAEAFDQGMAHIDKDLAQAKTWTAAPTFFARLKADKRVRKLTGGVPDAYPQSGRIGPAHVETFDRQTAMALALLDEIPPKAGKMQTYLLRPRGEKGQKVEGWCPNSAVLSVLLKNLFRKDLTRNDMLEWEVFAMADEGGHLARQIAAQFEPLNPA